MNWRRHHQGPAAIALRDNCIYLARDGAMLCHAKTAGFLRGSDRNSELMDGRTLALYANLGDRRTLELPEETNRRMLFATRGSARDPRALPPWSTTFAIIGAA